jgi:hypothetical protein
MLRFADADEAEAVYSMVSLTQAAHRQQQCGWQQNITAADVKGPVIEVRRHRQEQGWCTGCGGSLAFPTLLPAVSVCSVW